MGPRSHYYSAFKFLCLCESSLVVGTLKVILSDTVCPKLAFNTSICIGGTEIIGSTLLEVIHDAFLDPTYFCEHTLNMCKQGNYKYYHAEAYANEILKDKPDGVNGYVNKLYAFIKGQERNTLKIAHISDPHIDYRYTVGADQKCNNYLCCQPDDGFPSEVDRQAKPWGSYLCDLPPQTFKLMLEYIKNEVKPDIIVWTGDNAAHQIWSNTPQEVIDSTNNITKMIRDEFYQTNVTVLPINGNHDYWPANNQDLTNANNSIFLQEFSKSWKDAGWLTDEEIAVFTQYGYYSKPLTLKDGRHFNSTRVIAINTMSCYFYNFLVLKSRYDPGEQIEWLEGELKELEALNGQALIIGHVPPMHYECMHGWSFRFKALMDRYQHIVRFGLYGHQHHEMIQTYTSVRNPNQRIGIGFLAGSATTYYKMNPSFNEIEMDEEFMVPVNIKTHFFNISAAEQDQNNAKWSYLHDYLETYNLQMDMHQ